MRFFWAICKVCKQVKAIHRRQCVRVKKRRHGSWSNFRWAKEHFRSKATAYSRHCQSKCTQERRTHPVCESERTSSNTNESLWYLSMMKPTGRGRGTSLGKLERFPSRSSSFLFPSDSEWLYNNCYCNCKDVVKYKSNCKWLRITIRIRVVHVPVPVLRQQMTKDLFIVFMYVGLCSLWTFTTGRVLLPREPPAEGLWETIATVGRPLLPPREWNESHR